MKKIIVWLLWISALLWLGYGSVFAQSIPNIGSAMTTSIISQPYQQSQCVEPDGSIVYVNRQFYLWDTYTTTDVVPKWGNGYDTLLLNASKVLLYNSPLFNFTSAIQWKSNGVPNSASVNSIVSAQGTFVVSSTVPWQLVYNIHRAALYNQWSNSYSIAYLGRPNLINYTAQLTNKAFYDRPGRVVDWYECVNYTVHYCGDGVKDTQQSIANLPWWFANSIANEQCDGTDWVTAGYMCTRSCTLQTIVVKPTCTLSVSSSSIIVWTPLQTSWTINGSYTNAPQITYTPTTWNITWLPYTVTTAAGQHTITPQDIGDYTLSMMVSNKAWQSYCTAQISVTPQPQHVQCSLNINPNPVFVHQIVSVWWNVIGGNFFWTYIYVTPALWWAWPYAINANQYNGTTSVMPTQAGDYNFSMMVNNIRGAYTCTGLLHVMDNIPPTCLLTTSTPTIVAWQSATLQWSYAYATSASFSPTIGWISFLYPSRSNTNITVTPTTTTTYTLTVHGAAGTTSAICPVTITVNQPAPVNPTCSLTVNTWAILSGQTAVLHASYTNALSATFTPTIAWLNFVYPTRNTSIAVTPTTTTTYTLTVHGAAGTTPAICKTLVTVNNPISPKCSLTTTTPTIISWQTATLNASYTNAALASITPTIAWLLFSVPSRSNTNIMVTPTTTTIYTMVVTGQIGTTPAICPVTITVNQPAQPAQLSLTKTLINNTPYHSWDLVSFRIDFANIGNTTVHYTILTDYLPAGLTYVSSQIFGILTPYTIETWTFRWADAVEYSGFSLLPGQTGYMIVTGKFKWYTYSNQTINNVFLRSKETDILHAVAMFSAYTPSANATITKSADKTSYYPGENVKFTIAVTNNGPDAIDNVQLIDIWPINNNSCVTADSLWLANTPMTMSNTSNLYTWNLTTSLPVGQTVYLYLTGHIGDNQSCIGNYTNTVDLRYMINGQAKTGRASVNVNVLTLPASTMSIEKSLVSYGNNAGDAVVFEVLYKNNGTATITNYDIVDYWPGTLTFVSASPMPTSQTSAPWGEVLHWIFTTPIAPNGTGKIIINGRIK